jgi:UDP-N-acetylglucosamine acyltransferase
MSSLMANIHPKAKIGANVTIEPFATIYGDVEIGDGTWVGPSSVIMEGSRIGKNCKIFPGAVIGGIPQDLKFQGEYSTAEIGDNTTVRECVTVNRGTASKQKTVVGSNTLLMAYAHIAHDCNIGSNCIIGNSTGLAGEIVVEDWAIVSAMSGGHQFVRIGAHAFVGATSKIGMDVPPFILCGRDPLSFMGVNKVGLQRRGFSNEQIAEIHEIYRYIYLRSMNRTQAMEAILQDFKPSAERDQILNFIKESKRGIIKGPGKGNE